MRREAEFVMRYDWGARVLLELRGTRRSGEVEVRRLWRSSVVPGIQSQVARAMKQLLGQNVGDQTDSRFAVAGNVTGLQGLR